MTETQMQVMDAQLPEQLKEASHVLKRPHFRLRYASALAQQETTLGSLNAQTAI